MRRLPDGFDGNTCPYIFTWSTERPNKVWGMGSGCSPFYNTVRCCCLLLLSLWNIQHRVLLLFVRLICCSWCCCGRSPPRTDCWHHSNHYHLYIGSAAVAAQHRTRRVSPTRTWNVSLMKIALTFMPLVSRGVVVATGAGSRASGFSLFSFLYQFYISIHMYMCR